MASLKSDKSTPLVPRQDRNLHHVIWHDPAGTPLNCTEKIKVLEGNITEIIDLLQSAAEDTVLMGGDENQLRDVLHRAIDTLTNPLATPNEHQ